MHFEGKVALVTGGAMGIGRAIATMLAARGAAVGICDIDVEGGEATARSIRDAGGRAIFEATDVANPDAVRRWVDRAVAELGRLDVLMNNAAIAGSSARIMDLEVVDWQRALDVNINGHFYCAKFAVPHLIRAGGGAIVNTSSVLAVATMLGSLPYIASKAAVIGFTRALAHELGPNGIRVNCLLPGSTDTRMLWGELVAPEVRAAAAADVAAVQPLRRYAQPEEIAEAALFLASDQARFVTGASLVVDGGLLTRVVTPAALATQIDESDPRRQEEPKS